MKPIEQRLIGIIKYLEEFRSGYRYEIILHFKEYKYTITIKGNSYVDKSLPFDFISIDAEDFQKLPEIALAKCKDLVDKEILARQKEFQRLQEAFVSLNKKKEELDKLSLINETH